MCNLGVETNYRDVAIPQKLLPLEDGWAKFWSEAELSPDSSKFGKLMNLICFLQDGNSNNWPDKGWIDRLSGLAPEEIMPYWNIIRSPEIKNPTELPEILLKTKATIISALVEHGGKDNLDYADRKALATCARILFDHDLFAVEEGGDCVFPLEAGGEQQKKENGIQWAVKRRDNGAMLVYLYDPRRLDRIGDYCFELTCLGLGLNEKREAASRNGKGVDRAAEITEAEILKIVYTDYRRQRDLSFILSETANQNGFPPRLVVEQIKIFSR